MSLGYGGSVILLPRRLRGDPLAITEVIAREGVTFTNATPTEYSAWLRYGNADLMQDSRWKIAISGGEHVRMSLLQQFQQLDLPDLRVFNSYGPRDWAEEYRDEVIMRANEKANSIEPKGPISDITTSLDLSFITTVSEIEPYAIS